MADTRIEIPIDAIDEFSGDFAKLNNDLDKLKGAASESGGAAEKGASAFSALGKSIGFAIDPVSLATEGFHLLKDVATAAAREFAAAEVVGAQLDAVLRSTGGSAGITRGEIDELANELQDLSGTEDEVIRRGAALMLTFTQVSGDVFPKAIEAALNLSMAMGTDLQSSIIQVGKALNEPIQGVSALRRVGVQLSDEQEAQIKQFMDINDIASAQNIILGELETQFGGVAAAMGDTTTGSANKLKAAWGDLLEAMGEQPAGGWKAISDGLTGIVKSMTESVERENTIREALAATNEEMHQRYLVIRQLTPEMENVVNGYIRAEETGKAWERALKDQNTAIQEQVPQVERLTMSNQQMWGLMGNFQGIADKYAESMDKLREEEGKLLAEKQNLINMGYSEEGRKVGEVNAKLDENIAKQQQAAQAAQEAVKVRIAGLIEQQLMADKELSGADMEAILAINQEFGLMSEQAVEAARATSEAVSQYLDTGDLDAFSGAVRNISTALLETPEEKTIKLNFETTLNGNEIPLGTVVSIMEGLRVQ